MVLRYSNRTAFVHRAMTFAETEKMIYEHALILYKRRSLSQRTFNALFGVSNTVIAKLWMLVKENAPLVPGPDGFVQPSHLLWVLMFLKQYAVEEVLACTVGVTAKTFRKHVRKTMDAINSCYSSVVSNSTLFYEKKNPNIS